MMSSPTDSGSMGVQRSGWWLETWKSYVCAALAAFEGLMGLVTLISVLPSCIVTGVLQLLAAIVVLAIEAPAIVSFLSFAAPIGMFFDNKPQFIRPVVYLVIAIIPCLIGCVGIVYYIGAVAGIGVAIVYGLIILGPKASRDQMKFQAGATAGAGQPYSPTSP